MYGLTFPTSNTSKNIIKIMKAMVKNCSVCTVAESLAVMSKKLDIKFLPRLAFVEDNSFEYAEKIERLIKKNKENETEKKRYN